MEPEDIPRTHHRALPVLEPYQVEGRIRAFKKPKSMVKGDIFPVLFDKYATLLAIPLTDIYNAITSAHVWPTIWKQEFVTVIPKCRNPEGLGDLRNISCTMLASKIYESFDLNWLGTEVSCKKNQYGGVKGCGVGHLLVEIWNEVCTNLEDARAATLVTAVDYAKAFNRLSFQHCLRAFARKGASTETIKLLATFLSNRTMSVRVKDVWSAPLPVYGGVPQGSILGVLLFNISTDDLEDEDNDGRQFLQTSDENSPDSEESGWPSGAGAPETEGSGQAGGRHSLAEDHVASPEHWSSEYDTSPERPGDRRWDGCLLPGEADPVTAFPTTVTARNNTRQQDGRLLPGKTDPWTASYSAIALGRSPH